MVKERKNYFIVASIVFALAGLLHLCRVLKGWDMIVGGFLIPVWISWIVVILTATMVWHGVKFAKKRE